MFFGGSDQSVSASYITYQKSESSILNDKCQYVLNADNLSLRLYLQLMLVLSEQTIQNETYIPSNLRLTDQTAYYEYTMRELC